MLLLLLSPVSILFLPTTYAFPPAATNYFTIHNKSNKQRTREGEKESKFSSKSLSLCVFLSVCLSLSPFSSLSLLLSARLYILDFYTWRAEIERESCVCGSAAAYALKITPRMARARKCLGGGRECKSNAPFLLGQQHRRVYTDFVV